MSRAIAIGGGALLVALILLFALRPTAPTGPTRPPAAPSPAATRVDTPAPRPAEPGTGAAQPYAKATGTRTLRFGDGPFDVGRRRDPETAAIGPSSLAVARDGTIFINDPVHGRLVRIGKDGKPSAAIKLPSATIEEVVALRDGKIAVVDRLGEKSVWKLDANGKTVGEFAVEGVGVREASGTTGLFEDPNGGLFVEVGHKTLVRVDGNSRATLPGRPRRDGGIYLRCAIADRKAGIVRLDAMFADSVPAWTVNLPLGAPVLRIALCDSDAAGNTYVGANVGLESTTPPYAIVEEKLVLIAIDPAGSPRGTLTLPTKPAPEETFRELEVGDDGTIYRMVITDQGLVVETYRL